MTPFGVALDGSDALRGVPAPVLEPSVRKPFEDTYAVVYVWPKYEIGKGIARVEKLSSLPLAVVRRVPPRTSVHDIGTSWHV
jgi:hypothetical protein